ncbi:MAG: LD-carboxypeptidase [Pseudomonadota bacterium]
MKPKILKPPRFQKGDSIGIIAPAGPVTENELRTGINILKSYNHEAVLAPHVFNNVGYMAGQDDQRLEDLHSMFQNKGVKAIFCARGGYGALRLLQGIEFELIRRNPKIIVGYSDITALLLAIYKKTGLVTFHGPAVREISQGHDKNLIALLDLIASDKLLELDLRGATVIAPGRAKGIFLGGNLSLITSLLGTPYMPSLKGAILFIEDKGEALYRIDRMLTHLKLSGSLGGLAGLMSGRFENCGEIQSINQLLLEKVSDLNIPVVSGLPVGHGQENMAVPLGLPAMLDTDRMTLAFAESCVTP